MSAIESSSVRVSTLADGTLRLVLDIEPRHAQAAFALFGAPGTAVALAALKTAAQQQAAPEERPRGGELAKWAGIRCGEPAFQQWLRDTFPKRWMDAQNVAFPVDRAAAVIRSICGIESRAALDNDVKARADFMTRVMGPWQKHCIAIGATA